MLRWAAVEIQEGVLQVVRVSKGNVPMQAVLREFPDIRLAYGDSDEYSFVFHRKTDIYGEVYMLLGLRRSEQGGNLACLPALPFPRAAKLQAGVPGRILLHCQLR